MDLDALLLSLLRAPDTCLAEELAKLPTELRSQKTDRRAQARSVLAALVLQRSDLASPTLVAAFLEGLTESERDPELARFAAALLARDELAQGLDPGRQLIELPCHPNLKLLLAKEWIGWRPETIDTDHLVALVHALPTPHHRARFLVMALEPWAWRGPVEADRIGDLEAILGSLPRWPYSRALLHRRAACRASRAVPHQSIGVSNIRDAIAKRAASRQTSRRILFAQNVDIGQGDEILRAGSLLALLFALDPDASVDLITRRRHLYDHPRIRCHSIREPENVRNLIDETFDGVVWLDEIYAPEVRQLPWLPAALREIAIDADWCLEATTLRNHLVLRQARLDGYDLLADFAPLRKAPHDAYESLELLALRLGLPWVGEECGSFAVPFVGTPSPEAERWIASIRGDSPRPLAVVQPFGGFAEVKGFCRSQRDQLAANLDGLVAEGYRVVLLPTGTEWGSSQVIDAAIARTRSESREHLVVAPDPADPALALDERPELEPADRAMRLFKYLIAAADLVISVDGWVGHLATLLERPVRLLLWAGSFDADWYPREVRRCESLCEPAVVTGHVFDDTELVLSRNRRTLLAGALRGLNLPSDTASKILCRSLQSSDPTLRAAVAAGSAPLLERPEVDAAVRQALDDDWPEVRAAAASALLDREDLPRPDGPSANELRAHCAIASQDWPQVEALGRDALPALARAVRGEANWIRREARRYLQRFMRLQAHRKRS